MFKDHSGITRAFSVYAKVSLTNALKNYWRAQWSDQTHRADVDFADLEYLLGDAPPDIAPTLTDVEHLERYFGSERLSSAVRPLSRQDKLILYLKFECELSDAEIARQLGVTQQAVNKRKRWILEHIKRKIGI